jgi:hypothetical protein
MKSTHAIANREDAENRRTEEASMAERAAEGEHWLSVDVVRVRQGLTDR